jgi:hypothetical protein
MRGCSRPVVSSLCSLMDGWEAQNVRGRWKISEKLAGGVVWGPKGHENPQFLLMISTPTPAFISLSQVVSARVQPSRDVL